MVVSKQNKLLIKLVVYLFTLFYINKIHFYNTMLNLKKQILNYKIKKIIKKYPYVLFIQFNNVIPKKWFFIKNQLSKLGILRTLRIKNDHYKN